MRNYLKGGAVKCPLNPSNLRVRKRAEIAILNSRGTKATMVVGASTIQMIGSRYINAFGFCLYIPILLTRSPCIMAQKKIPMQITKMRSGRVPF